jgi:hypothetical protein
MCWEKEEGFDLTHISRDFVADTGNRLEDPVMVQEERDWLGPGSSGGEPCAE